MDDEPLRVVDAGRDGDTVHFDLENTGEDKLYEFVKLFSDTRYIDLQYVDIEPGEAERVSFSGVSGGDRFTLSTSDRESGVLFSDTLTADTPPIREQDIDELAQQQPSEERWQELAEEFDALDADESEEKQRILERLRREYEDLEEHAGDRSADADVADGEQAPAPQEDAAETGPGQHPGQEEGLGTGGSLPDGGDGQPPGPDDRSAGSDAVQDSAPSAGTVPSPGAPQSDGQAPPAAGGAAGEAADDMPDQPSPTSGQQASSGPDQGQPAAVPSGTDGATAPPDAEQEAAAMADDGPEGPPVPGGTDHPPGPDQDAGGGEQDSVEDRVREMDEQIRERREQEASGGGLSGIVDRIFGRKQSDEETGDVEESEEGSEDEPGADEGEGAGEAADADGAGQEDEELLPSERVNRLQTGIIGLDEKMQGGFVEGTMNLVTGKTGVGKTAFCASFLKKGADIGESGVYVTTEERQEDIRDDIESMFGWRFEDLEDEGLVKILSIKPVFPSKEIDNLNRLVRSYISNLLDEVMEAVDEIDADRVIIDSVSIIEMFIRDEYMARVALASLLNNLREADVTALLTGTVPETSEGLSGGGIIEFLVDTVILLEFVPVAEEHKRTLTIRKMRRTDHEVEIFPFDITPDGIKIYDVME